MTTPTTYPLDYDDDFCASGPCGTGRCLGKILFNTRPQNFCEDVTLQKDVTIIPPRVVVGGYTFVPTRISTGFGTSYLVLAATE